MPQFEEAFGKLAPILRGFVVSSILLPSAVTGMIAGPLCDRLSRKRVTRLGAGIFALGSAIECGVTSLPAFIVGRCIAGAGEGLFLSSIITYLCVGPGCHLCTHAAGRTEVSPQALRGRFVRCGAAREGCGC